MAPRRSFREPQLLSLAPLAFFSLPLKGGGPGWGSDRAPSYRRPPPGPLRGPTSPFQGEVKRGCGAQRRKRSQSSLVPLRLDRLVAHQVPKLVHLVDELLGLENPGVVL